MENKNLNFLAKTADILIKDLDSSSLVEELKKLLKEQVALKDLNIYVFDPNTSTMRNYTQNWCVIDETVSVEINQSIYNAYELIHENDFIINDKAYKLPQKISDISFKITSLYTPIVKNSMVFGIVKIDFEENTQVDIEFLYLMKIFGSQISLKLQNIVLNEQSQINVEFHETQVLHSNSR